MIVYKIENLIDGKIYVVQIKKSLAKRIKQHKHNKKSCIGKAIQEYGFENFRYEIIENCNSAEELNEREKFWIKELNSKFPNGYNKTDGGEGIRKFSFKTKKIIRKCQENFSRRETLNLEIGSRIRLIREAQKKTREQIAEVAEISPQFLFDIESGKKGMTSQTIINLAKALNVSTDYILVGAVTPLAKIVTNLEGLSPEDLNLAEQFIKKFSKGAKK